MVCYFIESNFVTEVIWEISKLSRSVILPNIFIYAESEALSRDWRDDWKHVLSLGEVLHGCLHYGWYCQKITQFGIFVFVQVQEISFRGNLLGS